MTKMEIEAEIYEHMKAIRELHRKLEPEDEYISLAILSDGGIAFNNALWYVSDEKRINFYDRK